MKRAFSPIRCGEPKKQACTGRNALRFRAPVLQMTEAADLFGSAAFLFIW
jgi:hypothetical protein